MTKRKGRTGAKRKTVGGQAVGATLIRSRFGTGSAHGANAGAQAVARMELDAGKKGGEGARLMSVTDQGDMAELLAAAELSGREFTAERNATVVMLVDDDAARDGKLEAARETARLQAQAMLEGYLRIPRRPAWGPTTTAAELDKREKNVFLEWRRGLTKVEEDGRVTVTPFEKNLEVWRQLWRVVERSQLLVTVVDAREPLLYRCEDLEAYAKEVDGNKRTMLLLNKADLLPRAVRKAWSKYLTSRGIEHAFWSAALVTSGEASAIEEADEDSGEGESDDETDEGEEGESEEEDDNEEGWEEDAEGAGKEEEEEEEEEEGQEASEDSRDATRLLSRDELLDLFETKARAVAGSEESQCTVGLVGFPNVGKSSSINALMGQKKTAVAPMPGKTKHFQTLIVRPNLVLCDCPGLVFPSFTSSRAELVLAGVLPIDRMSDHRGPAGAIAKRFPRQVLEAEYTLRLPPPRPHEPADRPPTGAELLRSYANSRNYVAGGGQPDETRSARELLRDYLGGRLLYCRAPPDGVSVDFASSQRVLTGKVVLPSVEAQSNGGGMRRAEEEDEDEDDEGEDRTEDEEDAGENSENGGSSSDEAEEEEEEEGVEDSSHRHYERLSSGLEESLVIGSTSGSQGGASAKASGNGAIPLGEESASSSKTLESAAIEKSYKKMQKKPPKRKDRSHRTYKVDDTNDDGVVGAFTVPWARGAVINSSAVARAGIRG